MNINELFPSNYIKSADLAGQVRKVTIESCAAEAITDTETKPVLRFVGVPKGLILNKTNGVTIANAYGPETTAWVGREIELFSMAVNFQGRMVDAIRVRCASPAQPAQTAAAVDPFAQAPAQPAQPPLAAVPTQPAPAAPATAQPADNPAPAAPVAAGDDFDEDVSW